MLLEQFFDLGSEAIFTYYTILYYEADSFERLALVHAPG